MRKITYTTLIIGLLGYFLFYYQTNKLKIISPLKESLSKESIENIAVKKTSIFDYNFENLSHKTEIVSRRDYSRYISKAKEPAENLHKTVPSFAWQVTWNSSGKGFSSKQSGVVVTIEDESIRNSYIILDYQGRILEFGFTRDKKGPPEGNLTEADKKKLITKILVNFAEIDTISTPLKLLEKSEAPKKTEIKYERINESGIKETLFLRIRGDKFDYFQRKFIPDQTVLESGFNISTLFKIIEGVAIFIIMVLALVVFIKKAKRDELDYKRGLWAGVFMFIVFFIFITSDETKWLEILFAGLIGGFFVSGAFLILYIIAESVNRDVWKEKLTCIDFLFQGNFNVKKLGEETILGISFGGIGAFYFYILLLLSEKFNFFTVGIDNNLFNHITAKFPILMLIDQGIFTSLFLFVGVFLFLLSLLRYKAKKIMTFIVFGIIITPVFLDYLWISMHTTHVFVLFLIPFSLFLSILYYKREFFTVLLTGLSLKILTGNSIFLISPDNFVQTNGIGIIILFFILLIIGIYAYERGKDVDEIEEYRPDYLARLAEKERFLRELEIARNIQAKFLPATKPKIKGITVSSMCVPAMEVGGDYYDFIELDKDRLGVIIGDVSGKGVSAAFYMTLTKGIVKTAAKSGLSPREMLINLNHIFYENVPRGVFISVIYGIFDFSSRTLTFARAGHNPLILRKRIEAKTEMLHPEGLAVGLEKGDKFDTIIQEQTIGISKDDIFIFYTDGITESMNRKNEEFGEDKLINIVNENSQRSAEEVMNIVKYNLETFTGKTKQFDDQTMVIVKIEE